MFVLYCEFVALLNKLMDDMKHNISISHQFVTDMHFQKRTVDGVMQSSVSLFPMHLWPMKQFQHCCPLFTLVGRWWRGSVVERRSLAGELSLSCA